MPRKGLALSFILSLVMQSGAAMAGEKFDFDRGVDAKQVVQSLKSGDVGQPAPGLAEAGEAAGTAEWTVMVYVNAKNNLERFGLGDVNEMEAIGSTPGVNVVVELGRIKGYDSSDGNWTGSRRYLVQKDADRTKITSPVLQDIPKADMGDWRHLVEFSNWAKGRFPARRYMLIVWNHGSGWNLQSGDLGARGISYDDETGHHLSTPDLGTALAAIGKLDVYASDACLMQMAEVGYQIKDLADVIVGSEETEPGDGYDYTAFLRSLTGDPGMDAEAAGAAVVESYQAFYGQQNQGATQSAIRAAYLPRLVPLLDAWTRAVMAANEVPVLKSARAAVQAFYYKSNIDLFHFVELVQGGTQDAAVKQKGAALLELMPGLVAANGISGSGYENAKGLAIYLPTGSVSSDYATLAWAKEGAWDDFAGWMAALR